MSPRGVRTGAGFYEASGPRLAAFRGAVAHDRFGPELEKDLIATFLAAEFDGGERYRLRLKKIEDLEARTWVQAGSTS